MPVIGAMPVCFLKTVLLPLPNGLLRFLLGHIFDADDSPTRYIRLSAVILAEVIAAVATIADKLSSLRIIKSGVRDRRLSESLLNDTDARALGSRVRLPLVSLAAGPPVGRAGRDKSGGA